MDRVLKGDDSWHFEAYVIGDDIVVKDTLITCFGGWGNGNIDDPDDSGKTSSGRSTKIEEISGVALPLDTSDRNVDKPTHKALDGSPIPWLPWFIPVEVTIEGIVFTPPDGLVDVGPNKRVSKPGQPKALDLSVWAARHFDKILAIQHGRDEMTPRQLARNFEARGSYRIIGAAQYAS